jgi:anti-sigma-K factor RskA
MNGADQDRRDELASLYALGVIDAEGYADLQQEILAVPTVAADVRTLVQTMVGVAQAVPQIDPPASLRERVLTSVTGKSFAPAPAAVAPRASAAPAGPAAVTPMTQAPTAPQPRVRPAPPPPVVIKRGGIPAWTGWLATAAMLAVAVGLGMYSMQLRDRIIRTEQRAAEAERNLVQVRQALGESEVQTRTLRLQAAVLIAPDMAKIDLAGQPVAPGAQARAFWSRQRGMVFAATSLPQLPTGKVYQLWVVPGGLGATPISAGLLTPDPNGSLNTHFVTPTDLPTPAALAVTLEPAGGVSSPTGEKYLVGLTGL